MLRRNFIKFVSAASLIGLKPKKESILVSEKPKNYFYIYKDKDGKHKLLDKPSNNREDILCRKIDEGEFSELLETFIKITNQIFG